MKYRRNNVLRSACVGKKGGKRATCCLSTVQPCASWLSVNQAFIFVASLPPSLPLIYMQGLGDIAGSKATDFYSLLHSYFRVGTSHSSTNQQEQQP